MTEIRVVNVPAPFPGTPEQALANRRSHDFGGIDGRCWDCDTRPTGTHASYPCGEPAPRLEIPVQRTD